MPRAVLRLPRPAQILRRLRAARKPPAAASPLSRALPVTHAQAPSDPLALALSAFGLPPDSDARVLEGALRNETWLVSTPQGKKVLKRYKPSVDRDQILHEHSILARLEEIRFPSPRLVRTPQGATIHTQEARHYAVTDFLEGYFRFDGYLYFPPRSGWFLYAAGQTLAHLHESLRGFVPRGRNPNGFSGYEQGRALSMDWYLEKLRESQRSACSAQAAFSDVARQPTIQTLCQKAAWLEERACALDRALENAGLERRLIHGDFGPYNLMVRPGYPVVLLDFELARIDWRLVDLVSAISSTIQADADFDPARARRFLQGYQSVQPIPAAELRWLPQVWQFQTLRRLIICWWQYLDNARPALLVEAEKRLARLAWLEANPEILSTFSAP